MEGGIEHGPHQQAERPTPELVIDVEIDDRARLAIGAGGLVVERPAIFELFERAVDIFDQYFAFSSIAGDAAGEALADRLEADLHLRDDDLHPLLRPGATAHAQGLAERHEFGVGLDILDEREHVVGAERNAAAVTETLHGESY